jgi:hypothetical protein
MSTDTRHGRLTLFRAAALQGLLASGSYSRMRLPDREEARIMAVSVRDYADALMAVADRRDLAAKKARG